MTRDAPTVDKPAAVATVPYPAFGILTRAVMIVCTHSCEGLDGRKQAGHGIGSRFVAQLPKHRSAGRSVTGAVVCTCCPWPSFIDAQAGPRGRVDGRHLIVLHA